MVYKSFDELEAAVMQKAHKCKVAVVEAADEHVLEAVRHAVEVGLVEPLLFGKRGDGCCDRCVGVRIRRGPGVV